MTISSKPAEQFSSVLSKVGEIGKQRHSAALLEHARQNLSKIRKSLRDLPSLNGKKAESGIVISAGPSVHKKRSIKRILESGYQGSVIAVDGSYIACLREGLIPDYVLTLDPHPGRIVRWFGDPNFETNTKNDDYFLRQDLDVEFRNNSIKRNLENIELVNRKGRLTKAIVCSSAPANVVERIVQAEFDTYWWNPLVDSPKEPGSLTRQIYEINKLPCMNTGGNVGTAAWVFASTILKLPRIALAGMDLGYYKETPISKTQTYYELISHAGSADDLEKYFVDFKFPLTGETFFTDPTYFWYRKNLLELLEKSSAKTVNCTEGGTLFGDRLDCTTLDEFLRK